MSLVVVDEVAEALRDGRAVVALETSVLAQGLPEPRNREAAERMDAAVRKGGAVPAWTWVADGAVRVGAPPGALDRLMGGEADKVARRDLPSAVAGGRTGATTVSAMVWAAQNVGIEVAATGGIGGVHPGTGDVSADLLELARTPVSLVCSGPKSILDPWATMERLDELGVACVGYRCQRLPFFVVRETEIELEYRAEDPAEVATIVRARDDLGIGSALLVCNPVPGAAALPADEVSRAIDACISEAGDVSGKALTPHLLRCLAERTGGRSLDANLALLESNAAVAASVAAALGPGA
jgi:pseudouridylate synthase